MTPNDEHTERLLHFWQDYRFYIATGLAMLLALIAGFTYRHNAQTAEQTRVNGELFALLEAADDADLPAAQTQYEALRQNADFPDLALVGGMALVSLHLTEGDAANAEAMLQNVMNAANDEGLARLAALRLAELQIDQGEAEAAAELLRERAPAFGRLRILFNERLGDAEYANQNYREAETAYLDALQIAAQSAPFYVPLLRIKIGALLSDGNARRGEPDLADAETAAAEGDKAPSSSFDDEQS